MFNKVINDWLVGTTMVSFCHNTPHLHAAFNSHWNVHYTNLHSCKRVNAQ